MRDLLSISAEGLLPSLYVCSFIHGEDDFLLFYSENRRLTSGKLDIFLMEGSTTEQNICGH